MDLVYLRKVIDDSKTAWRPLYFAESADGIIGQGDQIFHLFIDLRACPDIIAVTVEMSKRLSFPYVYDDNWNGFSDQLSDLSWLKYENIVVVILKTIVDLHSQDVCAFLNIFQTASYGVNSRIRLLLVIA